MKSNTNATSDFTQKAEILPEFSQFDFIRSAWIALIKEDAPLEIFNEDFSSPIENEYQVFIESIFVNVSYQVSVGYDRQEPYLDYEFYYEDEPYLATETYYNSNTKRTQTRQVTKYKKVQKQRQVTRYKTVTDWSPLNGTHSVTSIVAVENNQNPNFSDSLFMESFEKADKNFIIEESATLSEEMNITANARKEANSEHSSTVDYSVKSSLPGDHYKDVDWSVTETITSSKALYKTPEYEAHICFKGKTYVKHAFPFGRMRIAGDRIENEASLYSITEKMKSELKDKVTNREQAIDKNISKATNIISIATIALLLSSIFVSIFIRSTALVITMLAISIVAFIFNTIKVKAESKKETKRANDEIAEMKTQVESEIDNYSINYKFIQLEALNRKLESLGLEPVSADEI